MATAPVKSQPLHNFSFPFLKWGSTTTTATTTTTTNHQHRQHSPSDNNNNNSDTDTNNHTSEPDTTPTRHLPFRVGSRSSRPHRSSFSSFPTLLPAKPKKEEVTEDEEEDEEEDDYEQEEMQKPWNLRPRKGVVKNGEVVVHETVMALPAVSVKEIKQQQRENLEPKSMRLRGLVEGGEKKEKTKFWIALSREEIEEDVFIMTGSRPARRPKKRSKIVQKQLDSVFPGLWLVGATADSYRVNDPPVKR